MKKVTLSLVVTLVLLGSFAIPAAAQNRVLGRVNVPFTFSANGQQLTAGNYELWEIGKDTVRLYNAASTQGVLLRIPQRIVDSNAISFVFHNYGTSAFLVAVTAPSDQILLPPSKREKELASANGDVKTLALQLQH